MPLPNSEALSIRYLRDRLTVPVYQTPPPKPPPSYIRLARVGGTMRDLVTDAAMISISAYASDPAEAADLANKARELLRAAPGLWVPDSDFSPRAFCRGWREAAGPAFYPDPDRPGISRYQLSGELCLSTNRR